MNVFERKRLNKRITLVAAGVGLYGIGVGIQNSQVYQLLPWIVVGVIGVGLAALIGSQAPEDRAVLTAMIIYAFGYIMPAFGLPDYGHDGTLISIYAILTFFGMVLFVTTLERYGNFPAGVAGFALGAGLSTGVLYVL